MHNESLEMEQLIEFSILTKAVTLDATSCSIKWFGCDKILIRLLCSLVYKLFLLSTFRSRRFLELLSIEGWEQPIMSTVWLQYGPQNAEVGHPLTVMRVLTTRAFPRLIIFDCVRAGPRPWKYPMYHTPGDIWSFVSTTVVFFWNGMHCTRFGWLIILLFPKGPAGREFDTAIKNLHKLSR